VRKRSFLAFVAR